MTSFKNHKALMTRKGNSNMPPTILKITSMVNPRILNGINMIQAKINRKKNTIAKGQHRTNRMHQSKIAMIDFM
jgi:hypothetical protein